MLAFPGAHNVTVKFHKSSELLGDPERNFVAFYKVPAALRSMGHEEMQATIRTNPTCLNIEGADDPYIYGEVRCYAPGWGGRGV